MKKGPLSKKDKQFIDENLSMGVEALAEKLERSTSSVEKYIKENYQTTESAIHSLFARKPNRGVTVMTEAASIASDDSKKSQTVSAPKRYTNVIHKIKD